jgi:hypothetical protein
MISHLRAAQDLDEQGGKSIIVQLKEYSVNSPLCIIFEKEIEICQETNCTCS